MTATTELVVPRSIPMILEAMSTPAELLGAEHAKPAAHTGFASGVSKWHTAFPCRFGVH
jgi:hypothetical protein